VLLLSWSLVLALGLPTARAGEDEALNAAVKKAVAYLKDAHMPSDSYRGGSHGIGTAALAGLALLESGVPPDDPVVANMAKFVRAEALGHDQTYGISLAIMFLDRLNDPADRPAIQFLGVRLLSGQTQDGGFSYTCLAELTPRDEARLRAAFAKDTARLETVPKEKPPRKDPPKDVPRTDLPDNPNRPPAAQPKAPPPRKEVPVAEEKPILHPEIARWARLTSVKEDMLQAIAGSDGSNLQFAVLALWVARKHGVPCDAALAAAEKYARGAQDADGGWSYSLLSPLTGEGPTPAMTCSGLIALAVSHGVKRTLRTKAADAVPRKEADVTDDPAVKKGLQALGNYITKASGRKPEGLIDASKKDRKRFPADDLNGNLYFLWSLERVAVTYDLETIGHHDWHVWGADALIATQQSDGSWPKGKYLGSNEEISASFALLFLHRANVAKDLTARLRRQVRGPLPPGPNPAPKGTDADYFDSEATRLAQSLIKADDAERAALLARLREAKGSVHTEALARAAAGLTGEAQLAVREALSKRLTRMTTATLREMLHDSDREVRRGAAAASGPKGDKSLVPDLIECIADADDCLVESARSSLGVLTSQNFGPKDGAMAADKRRAAEKWKEWWKGQQR
jgi:hypothetical protein